MKVPYYLIAASVPVGNRILQFHGAGDHSASYLIGDVARFRYAGFDVAIPGWPEPGPDDSIELRSSDRKVLRLYQDGTLIFRVRADHEFLGWGVEPDYFERFPKLNPVPVVEVNTSFVHLYRAVVGQLKHPVETVYFKLFLSDSTWEHSRLFLTKYFSSNRVDWGGVTKWEIQQDPAEEELEVSANELEESPNRVALRLVKTFVSMFDLPDDEIPFVTGDGDDAEVDLQAIKDL